MIRPFIDSAMYIKIFGGSFAALATMTTGAFIYVGNKNVKAYESMRIKLFRSREILNAQRDQLAKLRGKTVQ
ncbi:hypothetical protein MHLP_04330 [Candidatus Mycoplasma haematolamae str. Purdue]|uniref:Transmembrane protein n=1 Tax=Mycoplasma haematolamae (strain Purdue) TaxID=1212765 RepID=I7CH13_MYCHA|nr:hypothetical protein [Candidatus Mycoplasma haematolamae]AFO52446.1 hypothetical protein MHLP_04330 [Candidatus Mycoplasma haematolamae str. Purdue]